MKNLTLKTRRDLICGIKVALALAALTGGALVTPAFAEDNHAQDRGQDHRQDARHGRADHRDDRGRRGWHEGHNYGHPYYYAQPVYVPPPVYEAPRESPGISLFLPLNFRR